MINDFFQNIQTINYSDNLFRNITTIRESQDLYDDLSNKASDWQYAIDSEIASKPKEYSQPPIIHRPFEEQKFIKAIDFPFKNKNWNVSRYSNGNYGVWYGALELNTTIHETVYHWRNGFLNQSTFKQSPQYIYQERRVFQVYCKALLLELRPKVKNYPSLIHEQDYMLTQHIGERLYSEGHPGLISLSARHKEGSIAAIFTSKVLSDPKDYCYLSYILDTKNQKVIIEREPGITLMTI